MNEDKVPHGRQYFPCDKIEQHWNKYSVSAIIIIALYLFILKLSRLP